MEFECAQNITIIIIIIISNVIVIIIFIIRCASNESGDRAVGVVPAKRPHRARQTHKTTASRTSSTPNDRAVFPEEPLLMVLCVYKSSARRAVRTPMGGTAPRGVPASLGPGEPPLVIP